MWASGKVIRSTTRSLLAYCIHWFYHSIHSGHKISLQIQPSSWRAPGSKNSANLNPHKPLSVLSVGSALPTHPQRTRLNILGWRDGHAPLSLTRTCLGSVGKASCFRERPAHAELTCGLAASFQCQRTLSAHSSLMRPNSVRSFPLLAHGKLRALSSLFYLPGAARGLLAIPSYPSAHMGLLREPLHLLRLLWSR